MHGRRVAAVTILCVLLCGGCQSREAVLAEIEARLTAHARACFAPGRRIGEIDACMRGRGFPVPGGIDVDSDKRSYRECEPVPAWGRSRYCVALVVRFVWPSSPRAGQEVIMIDDATAARWSLQRYDMYGFTPRM